MQKTVVTMQKIVVVMTRMMMTMTSKTRMLMIMVLRSRMHFRNILSPSTEILREGPLGEGQHAYAFFASSTVTQTGVAQHRVQITKFMGYLPFPIIENLVVLKGRTKSLYYAIERDAARQVTKCAPRNRDRG
jgi:hypothetical protein